MNENIRMTVTEISLKFVEGQKLALPSAIDLLAATQYRDANLPDCVAFDIRSYLGRDKLLEFKQQNIRYWFDDNKSYSRTSKWYFIFAIDVTKFFDSLIGTNFVNDFNFEHYKFNDVMTELLHRKYINSSQYNYYMKYLPHDMSVSDMVKLLDKRKSYQDYIDYINTYDGTNGEFGDSLMTLIGKGQKYMPPGECIIDYVNPHVLEVFNGSHLSIGFGDYDIFESPMLMNRLLDYVKEMDIGSQYMFKRPEDYEQILTNVSNFLSQTKLLTKLEVSGYPDDTCRFSRKHLNYLLPGLAINTSLKNIIMTDDDLSCQDVQLLVVSLNPQSQVKFINIYDSLNDRREKPQEFTRLLGIVASRNIRLHYD